MQKALNPKNAFPKITLLLELTLFLQFWIKKSFEVDPNKNVFKFY